VMAGMSGGAAPGMTRTEAGNVRAALVGRDRLDCGAGILARTCGPSQGPQLAAVLRLQLVPFLPCADRRVPCPGPALLRRQHRLAGRWKHCYDPPVRPPAVESSRPA